MCVVLQEVCECVYLCKSSVLNWILKGRMYGLIAYPLRWNMLLNDVVHLSTGYILSIFLSWKENTNKPVKQNKKYKKQKNFSIKIIMISFYDGWLYSRLKYTEDFNEMFISFCETQYAMQDRKTKTVILIFYSKDSKAVNKDFVYARRRRTIFTSLD